MRQEIRFAGFGGQGIVLSGYITGKAAAVYDEKQAIFTQSYGPEARGGACSAQLVVDTEDIDYPLVSQPDITVIMSQEAFNKFAKDSKPGSTMIVDQDLVETDMEGENVYRVPMTRLAEEMGRRIVANIVMLGAFTAVTGLISKDAMLESVKSSVPAKTIDLNVKAFEAGYEYARRQKEGS
jgi:2-oxoglutarate ferredoxin oxidoreductase subunit gamma